MGMCFRNVGITICFMLGTNELTVFVIKCFLPNEHFLSAMDGFVFNLVNQLRTSDTTWCYRPSVSAPSHYLNQCWNIDNWTLWNKFQWNIHGNSHIFIQEDAFEHVGITSPTSCFLQKAKPTKTTTTGGNGTKSSTPTSSTARRILLEWHLWGTQQQASWRQIL